MPLNSPTHKTGATPGILYIISTPIGNLEDITYRAVRILSQVDMIAAEDTRQTAKLLAHYNIRQPMVSCHEHNEQARIKDFLRRLWQGFDIALVTDSGTPLVSDPGFRLVAAAVSEKIRVVPIPGPCAAVAALSGSGLPTDMFLFCGFLPKKKGRLVQSLESLEKAEATLIFYESPRRIQNIIAEMIKILGDRPAVVARELTKIHEEFLRGPLSEILDQLNARKEIKGECTLVVSGCPKAEPDLDALEADIKQDLAKGELSLSKLSAKLAKKHGFPRKTVYDMALKFQNHKTG